MFVCGGGVLNPGQRVTWEYRSDPFFANRFAQIVRVRSIDHLSGAVSVTAD